MKRILSLSLVLFACTVAVFADIAPMETPKPKPTPKSTPISTRMSIKMDSTAKVATLSIPREQLKELRAQIDQLEGETDNTASATGNFSRTQTIVSGAFLSLALVFGGLWFVRNGKASSKTSKAIGVLVLVGVVSSAATLVYANAGPPNGLRSISSTLFDKKAFGYWPSASGKIDLVVSDAQVIELKVPAPKNWPQDKENDKTEE